ncbi:MAG: hypothetical protein ABMB14_08270 [Myxococcota bacterium]
MADSWVPAREWCTLQSEGRTPLIALLVGLGWGLWFPPARAVTPEALTARLAEIEQDRALRITQAPRPNEADLRKAAGGAVVTGLLDSSSGSRAYGLAVVPLSIGLFWSALNDETRQPGYTAIAYSELLSGRACASGRRVLQYLPVPMLSDRWWIGVLTKNAKLMQASGGAVRELSWASSVDVAEITTESGKKIIGEAEPIGFTKGAWFLVALSEADTYVEYYLHTDPGGSISPGMASMFATKGVRDTIAAIQRFAKEAHPACPIE